MRRLWAIASAAALAACASPRVPRVGESPPALPDEGAERAYRQVLDRYTDSEEIYRAFEARLFAAATFQSPEFIEARVRRQGAFRAQPPAVVAERVAQERSRLEGTLSFFLGVHASDPKVDDFDKKGSMWRLALVSGVTEVTPLDVQRVGRSTVDLRAIYPYLDEFWVGYWVKFPAARPNGEPILPAGEGELTLKLASAVGRAELRFPSR